MAQRERAVVFFKERDPRDVNRVLLPPLLPRECCFHRNSGSSGNPGADEAAIRQNLSVSQHGDSVYVDCLKSCFSGMCVSARSRGCTREARAGKNAEISQPGTVGQACQTVNSGQRLEKLSGAIRA